jgi:hypothetical protein
MVLSKMILAFFFAANVAAMAVLYDPKATTASGGTIHDHDGDLFISHTLPDGTQKVQYLSEYEETIPEGNTIDCHTELKQPPPNPICAGPLINPYDAQVARMGLARWCGFNLDFTGTVTFYYHNAFAFVAYIRNGRPEPGKCSFTSINDGIGVIIRNCTELGKGQWIDDGRNYVYGIFNRNDYDPLRSL